VPQESTPEAFKQKGVDDFRRLGAIIRERGIKGDWCSSHRGTRYSQYELAPIHLPAQPAEASPDPRRKNSW